MRGYEAFGRPVGDEKREAAYRTARACGLNVEDAWAVVSSMASAVEDDNPQRALYGPNTQTIDLTGRYRLLAVLTA